MILSLALLFFVIATLYAAVGFGGGSGYLAAMGLLGIAPEVMKPTSLTLNIMVSGIATLKFYRAGHFSGKIFWPIVAMSIPFAFLGGRLAPPVSIYRPIVGVILLYAAYRLFRAASGVSLPAPRSLPLWLALVAGAGIGLLSGLVGVGGGIFLSPLVLMAGWADTRQTMSISAAFILVNSASGLLGYLSNAATLPRGIPLWLIAVGLGGWIGAEYGSQHLSPVRLRQLLAGVLVVGSLRMLFV